MEIKEENLSEIAAKNSIYTFITILISKFGGLIFTILIARLLLPELFGIYGLVLSIVVIAITISNLGIDETAIRYVSHAFGRNNVGKARSYFRYLLKIKGLLVLSIIIILLILSKFFAYNIFNKPLIFFPLILSSLYILAESLRSLFGTLFLSTKNLKPLPFLEAVLQTSKILIAILLISILSNELKVSGIFIAFAGSAFLFLVLSILILVKRDKRIFYGKIIKIEKKRIRKYLVFMGMASLSLVFFGSIDTLMLGKFVGAEYIGYYRASLGLIVTIVSLLSFSGILLPIFTQIHKKRFERGFQKTFRYIVMLTVPALFGLLFLANYLVFTIYGKEYMPAISSLYILSFLVLIGPLIAFYSTLFSAKEKVKTLAKSIFIALVINIILNYILIKQFLEINQGYAIAGVAIATVVSRVILLGILIIRAKSILKLKIRRDSLTKPILASIVMVAFLALYNYFLDINLILGIIEVAMGILIYFVSLWLIKGIGKEDFNIFKK